jgi:hypothetical protein
MTLELPWPFVTQGSQPVQVYDSVSFANNCFGNYAGGYSIPNYTLLADYNVSLAERSGYPPVQPSLRTHRVELDVVIPATGFAFVRQHLDIGTKGPYVDFNGDLLNDDISYGKDAANDATDPANGRILIPQSFSHPFSVWGFKCSAVTDPGCDTSTDVTNTNISISGTVSITNDNQFQKVVGVYGLVKYDGISVPGMVVQLSQGSTILGVAITDASGVYSIAYKSKNKSDKYTVTLLNPTSNATVQSGGFGTISGMPGSTTKTVNIKNSDYVSVDFPLLH